MHENKRRPDLRKATRFKRADLIVQRAEALEPADRALILAVFQQNSTVAELGRLMGVAHTSALRRRVRRLTARLTGPNYIYVLAHRENWSYRRAAIATACFLHGRTIREAARDARITYYAARLHYLAVSELIRGHWRALAAKRAAIQKGVAA